MPATEVRNRLAAKETPSNDDVSAMVATTAQLLPGAATLNRWFRGSYPASALRVSLPADGAAAAALCCGVGKSGFPVIDDKVGDEMAQWAKANAEKLGEMVKQLAAATDKTAAGSGPAGSIPENVQAMIGYAGPLLAAFAQSGCDTDGREQAETQFDQAMAAALDLLQRSHAEPKPE